MDSLIEAAAHCLAQGDPLGALKRVALRSDAPALTLRGIAMAQLGEFESARALLKNARLAFHPKEAVARARCMVAEAEIALASRELSWPVNRLDSARGTLEAYGDRANAAHAQYLRLRRLVLTGSLDEAERALADFDPTPLPAALRTVHELVAAGIAIRRIRTKAARTAIVRAQFAARQADIPALTAEVESLSQMLNKPAARLIANGGETPLLLEEVEALLKSKALVVDACRNVVRDPRTTVWLATRSVLFTLVRALAEGWPSEVPRDVLLARAFGARFVDESHRMRLRVEIGRLRRILRPLAEIDASKRGFRLTPRSASEVIVLAQPIEDRNGSLLALLADGQSWSSSALAIALGTSQRSVQRALDSLAAAGKVQFFGNARARRWIAPPMPGFMTILLLPDSAFR